TPEQIEEFRNRALEADIKSLTSFRAPNLERDVYVWFGCAVPLEKLQGDPSAAYEYLAHEVGMSLTEQRERMLDLVDELIGTMVEHACPYGKHFESWDFEGLKGAYRDQFRIEATGIDGIADQQEIAKKLYEDAEAVLLRKEKDLGPENFLRLFRNFFLQEIDRQWIEHLQAMDHLRDGIGLRGYGQRDPKKEYKKEGFSMFQAMLQSVKSQVSEALFTVERAREEDLERLEAQRRSQAEKRQAQQQTSHPGSGPGAAESPAAAAAAAARGPQAGAAAAPVVQQQPVVQTVRREGPKIGRYDKCWCDSGKKYKNCHMREDQIAEAQGGR
ncbi:MAG: SEC-C domain-containing protein, partial [Polyangiaceae bacterium]|nr:SEC-C domain-containing protein [Polyangiaceae bacterium]